MRLRSAAPILLLLVTTSAAARVKTGFETLAENNFAPLRGKKIGFITNPTAVLPDLRHEADVLAATPGLRLVALFGPEHGFRGAAQAGASEATAEDAHTHVPVFDIYGKRGPALVEILRRSGAEILVFDMQDAGARFYTFTWTLRDCLAAAATLELPFLVLDRPNPIDGVHVAGPVLHPEFASGVGREPIAVRHGMTPGELARLFNGEFIVKDAGRRAPLTVIPLQGWTRELYYEDTGLPWVLPSPNLPTVESALLFCGTALFEGTNLSEGRGTTRPFHFIGAPYVDRRFAAALADAHLPGAAFREAYFQPTFDKYQGVTVAGVEIYVTDRKAFDPIRVALEMLVRAKALYPQFAWRKNDPTKHPWIDLMSGSALVREAVDAGKTADEIVHAYREELDHFASVRAKYLLYSGPHKDKR